VQTLVKLGLSLGFVAAISAMELSGAEDRTLAIALSLLAVAFCLSRAVVGGDNWYGWLVDNPNTAGMLFVPGVVCCVAVRDQETNRRSRFLAALAALACAAAVLLSGARASLVALLVAGGAFLWLRRFAARRWLSLSPLPLVLVAIALFTYIYAQLSVVFSAVDFSAVKDVTGKNLLSGRNEIWPRLIAEIVDRPLLGYGLDAVVGNVTHLELSAHSWYLQLAYQSGLVGMAGIVLWISGVWRELVLRARTDRRAAESAALFLGLLVQDTFEVSLTQNDVAIGVLGMLVVGVGLQVKPHQIGSSMHGQRS